MNGSPYVQYSGDLSVSTTVLFSFIFFHLDNCAGGGGNGFYHKKWNRRLELKSLVSLAVFLFALKQLGKA